MRLILDTHILLWVMGDDPALPSEARTIISRAETVYASAVSVWEVSIQTGLGKRKSIRTGLSKACIYPASGRLPLPGLMSPPSDSFLEC